MVQMILFTKQKYNHRHRKQMYGQMWVKQVMNWENGITYIVCVGVY